MTALITVEDFKFQEDKALAASAGKLLQKTYPGYGWGTRVVARQMIQICLLELIPFGGSNQGMTVNPKDWQTPKQFRTLVVRMGGELLERANLSRKKSLGLAVTKRPDGFLERYDHSQRTRKVVLR